MVDALVDEWHTGGAADQMERRSIGDASVHGDVKGVDILSSARSIPRMPRRRERTHMDGPDLLAARLLRALVADDVDTVAHLVVEIEDSGYAGLVATGLAQSYISELLKTARRKPLLRALETRILELTTADEDTDDE
jgi:hypothetical protein